VEPDQPAESEPDIGVLRHGDDVEVIVDCDVDLRTEPALRRVVGGVLRGEPVRLTLDFCRSSFVGVPGLSVALAALRRAGSSVSPRVRVRGDRRVRRLFEAARATDRVEFEDCSDQPVKRRPLTG
jgi:hypothetical protein